jgi:hypothetical protein
VQEGDKQEQEVRLPGRGHEAFPLFQSSTFCLNPQGDTYTRRWVFEAVLAVCISVFFHLCTVFVQYTWHLAKNYTEGMSAAT